MELLKVINQFRFHTTDAQGRSREEQRISDEITQMEKLASTYNFSDEMITLYFFGDLKSDLKFRVECNDPETQSRIANALKQYQKNL